MRHHISAVLRTTLLVFSLATPLTAQVPVYPYPGDATWAPVDRFWQRLFTTSGLAGGGAEITAAQPYGGTGSLALRTTESRFDWGFYAALSGGDPETGLLNPWGALGDISTLSFAWRRDPVAQANPYGVDPWPDAPWQAQTPVLRLLLGDANGLLIGELVWEKYYTEAGGYVTPYEAWQAEDLVSQNFWFSGAWGEPSYVMGESCQPPALAAEDRPTGMRLLLETLSGWATGSSAPGHSEPNANCVSLENALVYGIAVGVGSNWPDAYQGYVDYVRLGFGEVAASSDAVYANFEVMPAVVPEPGIMLLLATGLGALMVAQLLVRRG